MSNSHPWCQDVPRDLAVRAAEDAAAVPSIQHRDLPAAVEALTERVGRLEAVTTQPAPPQPAPVPPADGLRTERVTLEVRHRSAVSIRQWTWKSLIAITDGESVRVVEEAAEIARLTAERDEANSQFEELKRAEFKDDEVIGSLRLRVAELRRERDAARAEVDGLRRPATWQEEEAAVEAAWSLCGLEPDWPRDEPGTIVRHSESMRREIWRLRDCVAEVERERDAAIRERDEARAQCERLSASLMKAAQERDRAHEARGRIRSEWEKRGKALHIAYGNIAALKARVAELEADAKLAPAANAGGESNPLHATAETLTESERTGGAAKQEPVGYGVRTEWGQFRAGLYTSPRAPANLERGDEVVPLYAAPQPPRGWLTEEERACLDEAVRTLYKGYPETAHVLRVIYDRSTQPPRGWLTEEERDAVNDCLRPVREEMDLLKRWRPDHRLLDEWRRKEAVLSALLARSTPPRVKVPEAAHVMFGGERQTDVRDRMWIAAIREAGGEVGE